ncbi:hypothetical protein KSS87_002945 [Heliosperma pusillum]|nr:hypothetical protein KSS87_002945 [Heliosperma pusillum]
MIFPFNPRPPFSYLFPPTSLCHSPFLCLSHSLISISLLKLTDLSTSRFNDSRKNSSYLFHHFLVNLSHRPLLLLVSVISSSPSLFFKLAHLIIFFRGIVVMIIIVAIT